MYNNGRLRMNRSLFCRKNTLFSNDTITNSNLCTQRFFFLVGKQMATRYDCKFIETSVIINYNVDELLVGILTQIRLKLDQPPEHTHHARSSSMRKRSKSPLGNCGPTFKKYRGSRTSTSLRVKGLLSKVWARDSKSKSCENLHVL